MIVHEAEPYNAEPPRAALAQAITTSLDAFYARNHGPVPLIDPQVWRLTVDGLVDRPLVLSLDDLRGGFEPCEVLATLQCAGNRRAGLLAVRDIPGEHPWGPGATSTARWSGVRLTDVLQVAGIRPDAAHVAFGATDLSHLADPPECFGGSIPRHKALAPETLLAWEINGQSLPAVHGAPVRVVVPGYIGARSVKWVERITPREHPSDNYFQATAYRLLPADADPQAAGPGVGISLGPIAVNADILRPDDGERLPSGPTAVQGYALAGDGREVARVDVSIDAGRSWQQAELDDQGLSSVWSWRQWHTTVYLPSGCVQIVARAWDSAAAVQPESAKHLWNPKGYVNNSWARVEVVAI